jgi:DNA-binding CsgD family transcriptional regulator
MSSHSSDTDKLYETAISALESEATLAPPRRVTGSYPRVLRSLRTRTTPGAGARLSLIRMTGRAVSPSVSAYGGGERLLQLAVTCLRSACLSIEQTPGSDLASSPSAITSPSKPAPRRQNGDAPVQDLVNLGGEPTLRLDIRIVVTRGVVGLGAQHKARFRKNSLPSSVRSQPDEGRILPFAARSLREPSGLGRDGGYNVYQGKELSPSDSPQRTLGVPDAHRVCSPAEFLSCREREVAELAGAGLSNEEIADRLFISVATVKAHLTRAYRKLNLRRRSQLAARLGISSRGM